MSKRKKTYSLLCRFESLIAQVNKISIDTLQLGKVRYKPLFSIYNSCIADLNQLFPNGFNKLNLEDLPLYDANGKMLFTNTKISTLLHQSESIMAFLKGKLPQNYSGRSESLKNSLGWYWSNTSVSAFFLFISIVVGAFIAGTIFSETTLYKKKIKPFIIEYKSIKNPAQEAIVPNTPKNTKGTVDKVTTQ